MAVNNHNQQGKGHRSQPRRSAGKKMGGAAAVARSVAGGGAMRGAWDRSPS